MDAGARLLAVIVKYYAFYPPQAETKEVIKAKARYREEHGWDALQEAIDLALVEAMKVKKELMPELSSWRGKQDRSQPRNIIPFRPRARKTFPRREKRGQTRPNRFMRAQARG